MDKNEVVKLLKEDLKVLMGKHKKSIEQSKIEEGIKNLRLIKDTLDLIDKYDWKEQSSVYTTQSVDDEINEVPHMIDVISIWKQNSIGGQCLNHRLSLLLPLR